MTIEQWTNPGYSIPSWANQYNGMSQLFWSLLNWTLLIWVVVLRHLSWIFTPNFGVSCFNFDDCASFANGLKPPATNWTSLPHSSLDHTLSPTGWSFPVVRFDGFGGRNVTEGGTLGRPSQLGSPPFFKAMNKKAILEGVPENPTENLQSTPWWSEGANHMNHVTLGWRFAWWSPLSFSNEKKDSTRKPGTPNDQF